jgi:hypothetical protein
MLDIKQLREDPDPVRRSVELRRLDPEQASVDRLLELDEQWRAALSEADTLRARRNELSARIKGLKPEERGAVVAQVKQLKGGPGRGGEAPRAGKGAARRRPACSAAQPARRRCPFRRHRRGERRDQPLG